MYIYTIYFPEEILPDKNNYRNSSSVNIYMLQTAVNLRK